MGWGVLADCSWGVWWVRGFHAGLCRKQQQQQQSTASIYGWLQLLHTAGTHTCRLWLSCGFL